MFKNDPKMIVRHDISMKISYKYHILIFYINLGYYAFRLQTNGSALPSGRMINVKVFLNHETYRIDENNVLLFPFTQSIAHDISGLPNSIVLDKDGKLIFYDQHNFL